MRVILHIDYRCAPEGSVVQSYKAGDELTGKAAQLALDDGVGFVPVEETKPAAPLENKAKRGRK